MKGPPRFSPSCVPGRGPARVRMSTLWFHRIFPGEAVPWDAHTHRLSQGCSLASCPVSTGHGSLIRIHSGRAGIAQPDIQLWLQGFAALSRTEQPGQEGCRLGSQHHPQTWDAAISCLQETIPFAGAAGKVQLARGVSIRFSYSVATVHQVFVLVFILHTQKQCTGHL